MSAPTVQQNESSRLDAVVRARVPERVYNAVVDYALEHGMTVSQLMRRIAIRIAERKRQ